MKATSKYIIIVGFVILICLPYVAFLLFGRFETAYVDDNRKLAERPTLSEDNVKEYFVDYEKYINDHAPFRKTLISEKSKLEYKLFNMSPTERVIVGKDGMLFYRSSVDNYRCNYIYCNEELEDIKEEVLKTQAFFDEQGIDFYIFIPPNKAVVYDNYLPEYITRNSDVAELEQVVNYLKENTDVNIIYPIKEMHEFAKTNPDKKLFLSYDTHWNSMGAYVGCMELFKAMEIDVHPVNEIDYKEVDASTKTYDLARMMGLNDILYKEIDYIIEPQKESVYYINNNHAINADGNGLKVMMNRDSFTEALLPYLANEFTEVNAEGNFTKEDIIKEKPKIFIVEMIDRYELEDNLISSWNKQK